MNNQEQRAILIAFEGIDQSGKETQAARLAERLRKEGYQVHLTGFPDYETPLGIELSKFLQGERNFSAEVRQLLYAANRFEKAEELRSLLTTMDYIIIDRYKASGLAYGIVSGLDPAWCIEIEKALPEPDHVFLFDVPVEESFRRKQSNRDVYERNMQFLNQVREAYLKLAEENNWRVFSALAPIEQLESEVWKIVEGK
jgi:dTMP kinase